MLQKLATMFLRIVKCWSIQFSSSCRSSMMIYFDFIFVLAATFGKRKGKVRLDASSMSPLLSDQSRDRSPRPSIPSLDLQGFKCWNGNSIKHNESNESIEEKACDKSIEWQGKQKNIYRCWRRHLDGVRIGHSNTQMAKRIILATERGKLPNKPREFAW